MISKFKTTTVLAVRNNLEDTKEFYRYFRQIYPEAPLIISSGGSTDNTAEWLNQLSDKNLKISVEDSTDVNFSANFNKAISLVGTERLVLVHNDMVLGKNFLEELEKHSSPARILSYTTVEPPIFPGHSRPGKVVLDLGRDFSDFNAENFNIYENIERAAVLDEGGSFFMSGYKAAFDNIGGFDERVFNPYFCEEDDILIRFKLAGYELKTLNTALCYHFVSKTSRFSEEYRAKTAAIEQNSNRNFIRKWGSRGFIHKYDIGIVLQNEGDLLESLEPWCSNIYISDPESIKKAAKYIEREQPNTCYCLKERIRDTSLDPVINEILVYVDQKEFSQEDFSILQQLPGIIKDSGEVGTFFIGKSLEIVINEMNEYQNNLIKIERS